MPEAVLVPPVTPYWVVKVLWPVELKPWMNSSEVPCWAWPLTDPVVVPLR